ncbi:hypothetical protein F8388_019247 [Cannabis sativa]|uniref:Reverse transcriptase zinc-binding domain-containing protein n=1 Tax=Cannabis sativa TaxID=3483 RepID=A0A7J6FQZ9_CANSA|nr:hypothetical protein F8388_019247 [Cannabis sativa]
MYIHFRECAHKIYTPKYITSRYKISTLGSGDNPRLVEINQLDMWVQLHNLQSVRSAYNLLQKLKHHSDDSEVIVFWKKLWSLKVPPKAKDLVWRAASNCLATKRNLCINKVLSDSTCPMCGVFAESEWHILVSCNFAWSCFGYAGLAAVERDSFSSLLVWLEATANRVSSVELGKVQRARSVSAVVAFATSSLDQWSNAQGKGNIPLMSPLKVEDGLERFMRSTHSYAAHFFFIDLLTMKSSSEVSSELPFPIFRFFVCFGGALGSVSFFLMEEIGVFLVTLPAADPSFIKNPQRVPLKEKIKRSKIQSRISQTTKFNYVYKHWQKKEREILYLLRRVSLLTRQIINLLHFLLQGERNLIRLIGGDPPERLLFIVIVVVVVVVVLVLLLDILFLSHFSSLYNPIQTKLAIAIVLLLLLHILFLCNPN